MKMTWLRMNLFWFLLPAQAQPNWVEWLGSSCWWSPRCNLISVWMFYENFIQNVWEICEIAWIWKWECSFWNGFNPLCSVINSRNLNLLTSSTTLHVSNSCNVRYKLNCNQTWLFSLQFVCNLACLFFFVLFFCFGISQEIKDCGT